MVRIRLKPAQPTQLRRRIKLLTHPRRRNIHLQLIIITKPQPIGVTPPAPLRRIVQSDRVWQIGVCERLPGHTGAAHGDVHRVGAGGRFGPDGQGAGVAAFGVIGIGQEEDEPAGCRADAVVADGGLCICGGPVLGEGEGEGEEEGG